VLTAESPAISAADLPSGAFGAAESLLATAIEKRWTLKELSDAHIEETLRRAGGNRSLAARRLGVSRKFLWERSKSGEKKPGDPRPDRQPTRK
jgi:DNA-binding NtrC family response regulator